MMLTLALLLAAHGLIHLLGFARAFGFADLPQLTANFAVLRQFVARRGVSLSGCRGGAVRVATRLVGDCAPAR